MTLAYSKLVCIKVQVGGVAYKKVVQLQREAMIVCPCICIIISIIIVKNGAIGKVHSHDAAAVVGINSGVICPGKTV